MKGTQDDLLQAFERIIEILHELRTIWIITDHELVPHYTHKRP